MIVRPYAYVAALCKYTYTHTAMHSQHSVAEAWRSYFTQPLLWAAGTKLSFLLQPVEHYSSTNHTTATTTSTDVQRRSSTLAQLLSNWSSDKLSLQGWMEELWCELYTRLYIEVQDAELLQLWLHELSASTYSFPCIADTHSIVPTVSAKLNSTSKLPSTQSQPLQGWYLSGGQAKTVPLHWHYDSNNSSSSSSGSSSSSSNVTALQLAHVCSELCDDVVKCVGWSFGPQMAHDSVTAHDVPCSSSSSSSSSSGSMCRCVLHATARGDLATDAQHAVVGVQAAAAEHSITYSGVVQRDVAVYTGKQADTTQPNRVLAVVNFHWHIDAATVKFITQQLYPLCLPVGFDVVVVGPHSGIDGVLLNPWTNKGYYSGLSLALAYQRFSNYDGYLLVNDDLQINYAQMNIQHDFNEKVWGTFDVSTKVPSLNEEMKQFRKQGYHEWPWWDEFMEPTKAALADLHANYTHLMHTGAYLADITDSFTRNYSDVYYVPAVHMQDYSQLLQVFTQHHVFLELAVPTALSMLVSKDQYVEQPLCQQAVLEPERSQFEWRADCKLTHPIKLSNAAEQQHAIDMLTQHCAAHRNTPLVPHIYP
eukprot:5977-Heterococcus_DN1.PRE.2